MDNQVELMQEMERWPGQRLLLGQEAFDVCAVGTPPYIGGGEGLIELVRNAKSGAMYALKCFYEPNETRLRRAKIACKLRLAREAPADLLAGAPCALIEARLGERVPYAVLSKWCDGEDWRKFRNKANELRGLETAPPDWPTLRTRLLWAYGLTCAIESLENKGVVHMDISPGNVMVSERPDGASLSLVDFDGFFAPGFGVSETVVQGAPSYAAREIRMRKPEIGSDRVGMALIIQEFIVSGHPLFGPGSFDVGYAADDLEQGTASSLPFFKSHFGSLSELFDKTLQTDEPSARPTPRNWADRIKEVFNAAILAPETKRKINLTREILGPTKHFAAVVIKAVDPPRWWDLPDGVCEFNLDEAAGIGGKLRRDADMKIHLTADEGSRPSAFL